MIVIDIVYLYLLRHEVFWPPKEKGICPFKHIVLCMFLWGISILGGGFFFNIYFQGNIFAIFFGITLAVALGIIVIVCVDFFLNLVLSKQLETSVHTNFDVYHWRKAACIFIGFMFQIVASIIANFLYRN